MNDLSHHVREQRLWFAVLGRGFVALALALFLMSKPLVTPRTIAGLFVAYLIADAVLSLYAARCSARARRPSWPLAVVGVIDIASAAVAFAMPAILPLRIVGGARAIASGSCDVLWTRGHAVSELVILGGIAAVALGVVILGWPGSATVALPWLLGLEAMVSGALLVGGAMSEIKRGTAIVPQGA